MKPSLRLNNNNTPNGNAERLMTKQFSDVYSKQGSNTNNSMQKQARSNDLSRALRDQLNLRLNNAPLKPKAQVANPTSLAFLLNHQNEETC